MADSDSLHDLSFKVWVAPQKWVFTAVLFHLLCAVWAFAQTAHGGILLPCTWFLRSTSAKTKCRKWQVPERSPQAIELDKGVAKHIAFAAIGMHQQPYAAIT